MQLMGQMDLIRCLSPIVYMGYLNLLMEELFVLVLLRLIVERLHRPVDLRDQQALYGLDFPLLFFAT